MSLRPPFRPAASVGVFSRRLKRIPNFRTFLNARRIVGVALSARRLDAVAGWGHKPTASRARIFTRRRGLPYFAVEDGFLRSLDLGVAGAAPLSLIVDDMGVYYDCSRPSRLEWILNGGQSFSPAEFAVAEAALAAIRGQRLSKYNAAPDPDPALLPPTARRRILVVDQTAAPAFVAAPRCRRLADRSWRSGSSSYLIYPTGNNALPARYSPSTGRLLTSSNTRLRTFGSLIR
jgi:capsular polysaccharide export protein